jgi:hypothetical protein
MALLAFFTQLRTGFDCSTQQITGRDLRDIEFFGKHDTLGAFTGAGGTEKNRSHH